MRNQQPKFAQRFVWHSLEELLIEAGQNFENSSFMVGAESKTLFSRLFSIAVGHQSERMWLEFS